MRSSKPILLVEDNEVDAMGVKRAIKELKITNSLEHVLNGEEALDHLRNPEKVEPCIILLDLNMPRINGLEFLKIVKDDQFLKSIPVVIMTTSREEQDRLESFSHSIAGYMQKPVDYKCLMEMIRIIDLYWTLSELPEGH